MKRWFTIPELQAAQVPGAFLRELQAVHADLGKELARKCFFTGTTSWRAEFHISLFTRMQRRRLFKLYRTELDRS